VDEHAAGQGIDGDAADGRMPGHPDLDGARQARLPAQALHPHARTAGDGQRDRDDA
jgi:hypothetical protein